MAHPQATGLKIRDIQRNGVARTRFWHCTRTGDNHKSHLFRGVFFFWGGDRRNRKKYGMESLSDGVPSQSMRYLGIDLGDKRTGLALGDSEMRLATPVGVVEVPISGDEGEALLGAVAAAAIEQLGVPKTGEGEVVVGLPFNMDGSEGPRAKLAREFGAKLAARLGRVVHMHDERLTTAAADWSLAMSGLTHKQKKERRDALAAAAMLQSFLDAGAVGRRSDDEW